MKATKSLAIFTLLLLGTLAGCAAPNAERAEGSNEMFAPIVPRTTDPVVDGLVTDAEEIRNLLRELTHLERSRQLVPQISKDPAAGLNSEDPLAQRVTIEWRGEASLVLKRVADVAGWRFARVGSAPFSAEVRVKAVQTPLINVLEDVGMQLGNQADIVINKSSKTIELKVRG